MIVDYKFDLTTDASGDATSTVSASPGRIVKISVKLNGLDATADTTVKSVNTPSGVDETHLTLTNSQAQAHYHMDVAATKADGTASGEFIPPLHAGDLNVTIAQGGNATSATVVVYIEEAV